MRKTPVILIPLKSKSLQSSRAFPPRKTETKESVSNVDIESIFRPGARSIVEQS